jgi:hypothetical protein
MFVKKDLYRNFSNEDKHKFAETIGFGLVWISFEKSVAFNHVLGIYLIGNLQIVGVPTSH